MIGIGYWKNKRWTHPSSPYAWADPQRLQKSTYRGQKARVVDFLRSGDATARWMGYSHCRFDDCDKPDQEMGSGNLSDGVFDWPEGFVHYVEVHDVELPAAFLDYVLDGVQPPDQDLWMRWSARFGEFSPRPNPLTLAAANELATALSTEQYAPRFVSEDDHWVVMSDHLMIDAVPRCSHDALEAYLYAKRFGGHPVTLEEARRISGDSSFAVRTLRLVTRRPRVVVDHGQPMVCQGSSGMALESMDALELAYRVRVWEQDSVSLTEALEERYSRFWS